MVLLINDISVRNTLLCRFNDNLSWWLFFLTLVLCNFHKWIICRNNNLCICASFYVVPERYWFVSGGLQMPWLNFIRQMIPNSSLLNKCILTEAYEMHHWFKHHDIILNMSEKKKTLDCARKKEVNMPLFMSLRKSVFEEEDYKRERKFQGKNLLLAYWAIGKL